jgi:hypothetical protein
MSRCRRRTIILPRWRRRWNVQLYKRRSRRRRFCCQHV